jgi:protein kinase-like protein
MIRCPACNRHILANSTSCPACGAVLDDLVTRRLDSAKPSSDRLSSQDRLDDVRFLPGTMLAERYRIVGLIGRGGMGEVYRADDLKLGQPVALKFLPDKLLQDGVSLARFHREVRVARQVSHKNVCRVYDIGETNGHHFLSMEFIKGEELSSLLRRIGRLPQDKAIQIARQLCAGLAAAHESGVLHRDLKPSNVMIDGDGNARITDFGLAGLAEDFHEEEKTAGTPAYMAPEQFDGNSPTVRSDIYSLGLVLYEVFTGKKAYEAATLNELINLRRSDTTPTTPTSIVKGLDPVIESVIERCMQREPTLRPETALQIAAALPGGDPLAAALAAGETPSPEMVAAAPKIGTLRPAIALSLFGSVAVLLLLAMGLSKQVALHRVLPLRKAPEILRERANEIVTSFGYPAAAADSADGFYVDREYYGHLSENHAALNPWEVLKFTRPSVVRFWYRRSPRLLIPYSEQFVTIRDPPNHIPGMILLSLEPEGQLFYFEAVPEQISSANSEIGNPQSMVQYDALFGAAGLDMTRFQTVDSVWTPPHAYDTRQAWTGVYPTLPQIPIRVEAAAYAGKPVYFEIVSPWSQPILDSKRQSTGERAFVWILLGIFFATMLFGSLLALRNLRLGRGDRRGAFRVALFLFIIRMIYWLFTTHHVGSANELLLLVTGLQSALFWSCFVGLLYLALEPYLRRHWPQRIISWNRLLAGDLRDPLVGRDILIGALIGCFGVAMMYLRLALPRWLGVYPGMPDVIDGFDTSLVGVSAFAKLFLDQVSAAVVQSFMVVFMLLFLSLLFRRDSIGIAVGLVLLSVLIVSPRLGLEHPIGLFLSVIAISTFVFCAVRVGPLALMVTVTFFHLWVFFPITTELTAWYASSFVFDLLILLSLAFYGYYTSLGGQSPFNIKLLGEE